MRTIHPACPVFIPSEAELWLHCGLPALPPPPEHHNLLPEWKHPPQLATPPTTNPGDTKFQTTTYAELTSISTRAYALRASDPADFASAWETSIIPRLTDLLQKHCPLTSPSTYTTPGTVERVHAKGDFHHAVGRRLLRHKRYR